MTRAVVPTDPRGEAERGRVALWLDPDDLRWLADHCRLSRGRARGGRGPLSAYALPGEGRAAQERADGLTRGRVATRTGGEGSRILDGLWKPSSLL